MKILIIGNGGREHALAWKAAQSPLTTKIYVAPGNAGTAQEKKVENINISTTDLPKLLDFAKNNQVALTIVGPETPLALGIVDLFQQHSLQCFGPTQNAAQLESSKVFCKKFLLKHGIPTATYESFSDFTKAQNYAKNHSYPLVIKADGLAAGKGVVIAHNFEEATRTLKDMLEKAELGAAGKKIIIEEFLTGEEASFIVMTDGKNILPFATSQDHKARDNGDIGPNTGGMGAYSPAPVITEQLQQRILNEIIKPTIMGMQQDGIPYFGFLYAGVMISSQGDPKVLEFNCRLGDPETEAILMRLNSDLIELCLAAFDQKLNNIQASWDNHVSLGLVLASQGYPAIYPKGDVISGLDKQEGKDWKIFHAGTTLQQENIVTSGGRVLCVTTLAETVSKAQKLAYDIAKKIHWEHIYYRTDIGHRAIARELS